MKKRLTLKDIEAISADEVLSMVNKMGIGTLGEHRDDFAGPSPVNLGRMMSETSAGTPEREFKSPKGGTLWRPQTGGTQKGGRLKRAMSSLGSLFGRGAPPVKKQSPPEMARPKRAMNKGPSLGELLRQRDAKFESQKHDVYKKTNTQSLMRESNPQQGHHPRQGFGMGEPPNFLSGGAIGAGGLPPLPSTGGVRAKEPRPMLGAESSSGGWSGWKPDESEAPNQPKDSFLAKNLTGEYLKKMDDEISGISFESKEMDRHCNEILLCQKQMSRLLK